MSLRGATATRQSIWLIPARFAQLPLCLLALGALLPVARAHDPYEAFASVIVHPDRLELILTMAQSTALRLIDPAARIPPFTPENFLTHRPRLVAGGTTVFVLTPNRAPRAVLAARKVDVELTDENDVVFRVTYARPAPGRLHLHAAFVAQLGEGYGGIVEVSESSGNHLGWEQLTFTNLNLEVLIPPPPKSASPKKSAL